MTKFEDLIPVPSTADVEFILVGGLALFGEIPGGGNYDELLPGTEKREIFGHACRVVSLDALLRLKRSTGRAKDLEATAELEEIKRRQEGRF